MKKNYLIVLLTVILAVFAAACGTKEATETSGSAESSKKTEEITVKHQLGETKVAKNPEKVVVFDFGTLDTLDKLGIEAAGIPQENVPSYLSKYEDEKYENVGGLKEPDFEKINEMEPDLIIISGRQQDAYEELSKIAPTIFMGVDTTKYMESFKGNVTTLGEIFGKEEEAEKEFEKVEESIKALKEKASAGGGKALIILANDGKVSAYGAGSRFGIIHDEFGFAAADEKIEVSTHGQSISFEYIVEKDPDYLFVVDRGAVVGGESSAKQVVENDLVKNTKAYKNGKIIYLDPDYWYLSGGGLESVAGMTEEVSGSIE
ncbi:siderophore ABC transporter substrate-binding protein [Bacillus sp. UMB0893]|uniref:siderophore ABC transporter substrate-binding protein n=1 Tax=Bacillus sp. UMB0893 TaxID=2066053 RepID=UPI000C772FA6|nr:siderophore ABC transporter substrate-binding protein [Bacillus sp. UMB0893]PLR67321.1 ABC transporter [Bacillus sp. UMB0893]QNG60285.1 siderophore ABC transporter substrate-binding protein [Bacillus sp. PAMC26568]